MSAANPSPSSSNPSEPPAYWFRAKRYGWGFHFDAGSKVALVAVESKEYAALSSGKRKGVKVVAAMRSRRG